jgi:hypothetical protein
MRARHEPERRATDSPAAIRRTSVPLEILQRSIGNRAVQRLLALQRAPTAEQKKEFDGYVKVGDWGRAAWVLNEWQPGDITDQIKNMPQKQLEPLNEGAWHGGKGKVDLAVRARDSTAAIRGALRVLVWGKRWDEAAKQLELLGHAAALRYVQDLLDKGTVTGTEMRQHMISSWQNRIMRERPHSCSSVSRAPWRTARRPRSRGPDHSRRRADDQPPPRLTHWAFPRRSVG